MNNNIYKKYWIPPPIYNITHNYQNINNDSNLQQNVTNYFYYKILKLIKTDKKFSKYQYLYKDFKSKYGYIFIYKLLDKLVKKLNINWYDLRERSILIILYIYKKLTLFKN